MRRTPRCRPWISHLVAAALLVVPASVAFAQRYEHPPEEFTAHRQALCAAVGNEGTILMFGKTVVPAGIRFRQDNDFYYLTGFPEPDALAVLVSGEEQRFVLFTRPRDPKQEIWTGRRHGPDGAREIFGADEAELLEQLAVWCHVSEQFHHQLGHLAADAPHADHAQGLACYLDAHKLLARPLAIAQRGVGLWNVASQGQVCARPSRMHRSLILSQPQPTG